MSTNNQPAGNDHAVVVVRCPDCDQALSSDDGLLNCHNCCRSWPESFVLNGMLHDEIECRDCGVKNELHACPYQEATQFNDDPKFCNCCDGCTEECNGRI